MKRWLWMTLIPLAAIAILAVSFPRAKPASLTVGAGAGLSEALGALARDLQARGLFTISCSFSSTGVVASQVRQGAPLDLVVFPTGGGHMDDLEREGLLVPGTRCEVARDKLVLAVLVDTPVRQDPWTWLAGSSVSRVALGDPQMVPAGHYAYQVLDSLGIMALLEAKLLHARSVRQALAYLEQGEAEAALVYSSTVRGSGRVHVMAVAPPGSHQPIVFEAAVVASSPHREEAETLISHLASPWAARVFEEYGFDTAGTE
jgi:molybdate transport system substrate-binding protein